MIHVRLSNPSAGTSEVVDMDSPQVDKASVEIASNVSLGKWMENGLKMDGQQHWPCQKLGDPKKISVPHESVRKSDFLVVF